MVVQLGPTGGTALAPVTRSSRATYLATLFILTRNWPVWIIRTSSAGARHPVTAGDHPGIGVAMGPSSRVILHPWNCCSFGCVCDDTQNTLKPRDPALVTHGCWSSLSKSRHFLEDRGSLPCILGALRRINPARIVGFDWTPKAVRISHLALALEKNRTLLERTENKLRAHGSEEGNGRHLGHKHSPRSGRSSDKNWVIFAEQELKTGREGCHRSNTDGKFDRTPSCIRTA
jgi:hypothetical protein